MSITFKAPTTTEERRKIELEIQAYADRHAEKHSTFINKEGELCRKRRIQKTIWVLTQKGSGRVIGKYTTKQLANLLNRKYDYALRLALEATSGKRPWLLTTYGYCLVEKTEEERYADE